MTTARKAVLALIGANLIWGAASPIFKLSLQNIPPFTLAFWRFFLGSAVLLTFYGPRLFRVRKLFEQEWKALIFHTLSGITVNITFFFWGLQLTRSINAPVIAASAPIIIYVIAWFYLKERITMRKSLGIAFGFVGILTIILEPLLTEGLDGSILGNLFLIIATLGAIAQTIKGRKILPYYDPVAITFWTMFLGSLTFLPMATYEAGANPTLYQSLNWHGYMGIAFGSVLSSAGAYTLFNWGLSKLHATDASIFTYIDPIVGSVLGFVLLGEPFTHPFILGSLLIFGGILIAEGRLPHYPLKKLFSQF